VDLVKMWRRFEMSQKPAFIVNIEAPPGAFDINLSPDKREVVFVKQKEIIGD
jgi:DNA mismatch repair ATPase MutL